MTFSERDYRIRDMARAGRSYHEIHAKLGGSKRAIAVTLSQLRRNGDLAYHDGRLNQISAALPAHIFMDLKDEAARRGVTAHRLASMLLEEIARSDLFAAVLG